MSIDDFSTMVLLAPYQVGAASLKQPKFGMAYASLNDFDLEYCYLGQVISNKWPFVWNEIFQTYIPRLKYHPSDAVTRVTQVYKDANVNTASLTVQMYFNNFSTMSSP